jgi:hypothetical protein
MKFWSFGADPLHYKIESAIADRIYDSWITNDRKVSAGDRAIIWKFGKRTGTRGIVGFAMVETNPAPSIDQPSPYFQNGHGPSTEVADRVLLRYVPHLALPIWFGPATAEVLSNLSICRARGGTCFEVSAEVWGEIVILAGGEPDWC